MQKKLATIVEAAYGELVNLVRDNLTPDLLQPRFKDAPFPMGHCYVAAEAIYHLAGGKDSGLKPVRLKMPDGVVHWWLEGPDGEVIDPTHDQFHDPVPYAEGKPGGFLTRQPSKRAAEVINRVRAQERTSSIIDVTGVKPHSDYDDGRRTFIYIIPTDHLYLADNNGYHHDLWNWIYENHPEDMQLANDTRDNVAMGFIERNYEDHALEARNYWAEGEPLPDNALAQLEQYFGEPVHQTPWEYPRDWRYIEDMYDDREEEPTAQWPTNADEHDQHFSPLKGYEQQRQSGAWKLSGHDKWYHPDFTKGYKGDWIYDSAAYALIDGQLYLSPNTTHARIVNWLKDHGVSDEAMMSGLWGYYSPTKGTFEHTDMFGYGDNWHDIDIDKYLPQAITITGSMHKHAFDANFIYTIYGDLYVENRPHPQIMREHNVFRTTKFVPGILLERDGTLYVAFFSWSQDDDPELHEGALQAIAQQTGLSPVVVSYEELVNLDADSKMSATVNQMEFEPSGYGGGRPDDAAPVVYDPANDVWHVGPNGASHAEVLRKLHKDIMERNDAEEPDRTPGWGWRNVPQFEALSYGELYTNPFDILRDPLYVHLKGQLPPLPEGWRHARESKIARQSIELMYSGPHNYEDYQYWLNGGYHNDPDRARLAWVWKDGTLFIGQNHRDIMKGMMRESIDPREGAAFGWIDPTEDGKPWSFVTDYGTQDPQAQTEAKEFFRRVGPDAVMEYARNGTPIMSSIKLAWDFPPYDYAGSWFYQNGKLFTGGGGHYGIIREHANEIDPDAPFASGWIYTDGKQVYITFYSGALLGYGNPEEERKAFELLKQKYPNALIWSDPDNDAQMNDPDSAARSDHGPLKDWMYSKTASNLIEVPGSGFDDMGVSCLYWNDTLYITHGHHPDIARWIGERELGQSDLLEPGRKTFKNAVLDGEAVFGRVGYDTSMMKDFGTHPREYSWNNITDLGNGIYVDWSSGNFGSYGNKYEQLEMAATQAVREHLDDIIDFAKEGFVSPFRLYRTHRLATSQMRGHVVFLETPTEGIIVAYDPDNDITYVAPQNWPHRKLMQAIGEDWQPTWTYGWRHDPSFPVDTHHGAPEVEEHIDAMLARGGAPKIYYNSRLASPIKVELVPLNIHHLDETNEGQPFAFFKDDNTVYVGDVRGYHADLLGAMGGLPHWTNPDTLWGVLTPQGPEFYWNKNREFVAKWKPLVDQALRENYSWLRTAAPVPPPQPPIVQQAPAQQQQLPGVSLPTMGGLDWLQTRGGPPGDRSLQGVPTNHTYPQMTRATAATVQINSAQITDPRGFVCAWVGANDGMGAWIQGGIVALGQGYGKPGFWVYLETMQGNNHNIQYLHQVSAGTPVSVQLVNQGTNWYIIIDGQRHGPVRFSQHPYLTTTATAESAGGRNNWHWKFSNIVRHSKVATFAPEIVNVIGPTHDMLKSRPYIYIDGRIYVGLEGMTHSSMAQSVELDFHHGMDGISSGLIDSTGLPHPYNFFDNDNPELDALVSDYLVQHMDQWAKTTAWDDKVVIHDIHPPHSFDDLVPGWLSFWYDPKTNEVWTDTQGSHHSDILATMAAYQVCGLTDDEHYYEAAKALIPGWYVVATDDLTFPANSPQGVTEEQWNGVDEAFQKMFGKHSSLKVATQIHDHTDEWPEGDPNDRHFKFIYDANNDTLHTWRGSDPDLEPWHSDAFKRIYDFAPNTFKDDFAWGWGNNNEFGVYPYGTDEQRDAAADAVQQYMPTSERYSMQAEPGDYNNRAFVYSPDLGLQFGSSHHTLVNEMMRMNVDPHNCVYGWSDPFTKSYYLGSYHHDEYQGKDLVDKTHEAMRSLGYYTSKVAADVVPDGMIPDGWWWYTSWIYIPKIDKLLITNQENVNHAALMNRFPGVARQIYDGHLPIIPGLIIREYDYDTNEHGKRMAIVPIYSDTFGSQEMLSEDTDIDMETAVQRVKEWAAQNTNWGDLEVIPQMSHEEYYKTAGESWSWDGYMDIPMRTDMGGVPAIKVGDKIYRGTSIQSHQDVISDNGLTWDDIDSVGIIYPDGKEWWMPWRKSTKTASSVEYRDNPDPDNFIWTYSVSNDHFVIGNRRWFHTRYWQEGRPIVAGGYKKPQGVWIYPTWKGGDDLAPDVDALAKQKMEELLNKQSKTAGTSSEIIWAYDPNSGRVFTAPYGESHESLGAPRDSVYGWTSLGQPIEFTGLRLHELTPEAVAQIQQARRRLNGKTAGVIEIPMQHSETVDDAHAGRPFFYNPLSDEIYIGNEGGYHRDLLYSIGKHGISQASSGWWKSGWINEGAKPEFSEYDGWTDEEKQEALRLLSETHGKTATAAWLGGWIYDPTQDEIYTGKFHLDILKANPHLLGRQDVVYGHYYNYPGMPAALPVSFEYESEPSEEAKARGVERALQQNPYTKTAAVKLIETPDDSFGGTEGKSLRGGSLHTAMDYDDPGSLTLVEDRHTLTPNTEQARTNNSPGNTLPPVNPPVRQGYALTQGLNIHDWVTEDEPQPREVIKHRFITLDEVRQLGREVLNIDGGLPITAEGHLYRLDKQDPHQTCPPRVPPVRKGEYISATEATFNPAVTTPTAEDNTPSPNRLSANVGETVIDGVHVYWWDMNADGDHHAIVYAPEKKVMSIAFNGHHADAMRHVKPLDIWDSPIQAYEVDKYWYHDEKVRKLDWWTGKGQDEADYSPLVQQVFDAVRNQEKIAAERFSYIPVHVEKHQNLANMLSFILDTRTNQVYYAWGGGHADIVSAAGLTYDDWAKGELIAGWVQDEPNPAYDAVKHWGNVPFPPEVESHMLEMFQKRLSHTATGKSHLGADEFEIIPLQHFRDHLRFGQVAWATDGTHIYLADSHPQLVKELMEGYQGGGWADQKLIRQFIEQMQHTWVFGWAVLGRNGWKSEVASGNMEEVNKMHPGAGEDAQRYLLAWLQNQMHSHVGAGEIESHKEATEFTEESPHCIGQTFFCFAYVAPPMDKLFIDGVSFHGQLVDEYPELQQALREGIPSVWGQVNLNYPGGDIDFFSDWMGSPEKPDDEYHGVQNEDYWPRAKAAVQEWLRRYEKIESHTAEYSDDLYEDENYLQNEDMWQIHDDAHPFIWINGHVWVGELGGYHADMPPRFRELIKDWELTDRTGQDIYVGRVTPDGHVEEWQRDRPVPENVANDVLNEMYSLESHIATTVEEVPEVEADEGYQPAKRKPFIYVPAQDKIYIGPYGAHHYQLIRAAFDMDDPDQEMIGMTIEDDMGNLGIILDDKQRILYWAEPHEEAVTAMANLYPQYKQEVYDWDDDPLYVPKQAAGGWDIVLLPPTERIFREQRMAWCADLESHKIYVGPGYYHQDIFKVMGEDPEYYQHMPAAMDSENLAAGTFNGSLNNWLYTGTNWTEDDAAAVQATLRRAFPEGGHQLPTLHNEVVSTQNSSSVQKMLVHGGPDGEQLLLDGFDPPAPQKPQRDPLLPKVQMVHFEHGTHQSGVPWYYSARTDTLYVGDEEGYHRELFRQIGKNPRFVEDYPHRDMAGNDLVGRMDVNGTIEFYNLGKNKTSLVDHVERGLRSIENPAETGIYGLGDDPDEMEWKEKNNWVYRFNPLGKTAAEPHIVWLTDKSDNYGYIYDKTTGTIYLASDLEMQHADMFQELGWSYDRWDDPNLEYGWRVEWMNNGELEADNSSRQGGHGPQFVSPEVRQALENARVRIAYAND